jgi:hypothetical protein
MGNIGDENRAQRNQEANSQDSRGIARSWVAVDGPGSESDAMEPARGTGTSTWLPVVGFEAVYDVSSIGEVRSVATGRVLKPQRKDGYLRVDLSRGGKVTKKLVHVLVLEAFVGLCPPGMEARHVHDRTRSNCAAWNLAWGTKAENGADKRRHPPTSGRDLAGMVFGKLTALRKSPVQSHNARWVCRCFCGQERVARADLLIRGKSWSCASCAVSPHSVAVSP